MHDGGHVIHGAARNGRIDRRDAAPDSAAYPLEGGREPFYSRSGKSIFRQSNFRESLMNALRLLTVLLLSLAATAPVLSQDRRVPSSPAELRLSYAPIV